MNDVQILASVARWAKGAAEEDRLILRSRFFVSAQAKFPRITRAQTDWLIHEAVSLTNGERSRSGKRFETRLFDAVDAYAGQTIVDRQQTRYAPLRLCYDGVVAGERADSVITVCNSTRERKKNTWPQEFDRLEEYNNTAGRKGKLYCVVRDEIDPSIAAIFALEKYTSATLIHAQNPAALLAMMDNIMATSPIAVNLKPKAKIKRISVEPIPTRLL